MSVLVLCEARPIDVVITTRTTPFRSDQKVLMPHPIDVHVGLRVMQRRALLGMTQTDLANTVGLTFQQVQKYERGANRISASRLFEFASVLDVTISHFFDEMNSEVASGRRKPERSMVKETIDETSLSAQRETIQLVRAYYKIRDASQREGVAKLIAALARQSPG